MNTSKKQIIAFARQLGGEAVYSGKDWPTIYFSTEAIMHLAEKKFRLARAKFRFPITRKPK